MRQHYMQAREEVIQLRAEALDKRGLLRGQLAALNEEAIRLEKKLNKLSLIIDLYDAALSNLSSAEQAQGEDSGPTG